MIRARRRAATIAVFAVLCGACARRPVAVEGVRQFTFAWPYRAGTEAAPRGGTTSGPPVTLATEASAAWQALQVPGLSPLERDRRAILAMAGTFRASFDFLEVAGFRAGFRPDRPYQSWGTELVYVVHNTPRFIRLQHLLVMFLLGSDGAVQGPFVTKHWRQDWRYEDRDVLVYRGRNMWSRTRLTAEQARGAWTQAVFQVDDSPRYESSGRWEHFGNVSTWQSATTWRPLPRREFSVRHDYDVLVGTNRHTITPTGWVQEEENLKVQLAGAGELALEQPVLSKEVGLNRYERLADFDVSAGERYRTRTEPFWEAVRLAWDRVIATHPTFVLRAAPDQGQLFLPLFEYAEKLADGAPYDADAARTFAQQSVAAYLAESPGAPGAGY